MPAKCVWTVPYCARRLGSLYPHQWNIKTSLSGLQSRHDHERIWIILSSRLLSCSSWHFVQSRWIRAHTFEELCWNCRKKGICWNPIPQIISSTLYLRGHVPDANTSCKQWDSQQLLRQSSGWFYFSDSNLFAWSSSFLPEVDYDVQMWKNWS